MLNDRTKRIDRHEIASIGANRAVEVSGNQKHEIGGSMNTVAGASPRADAGTALAGSGTGVGDAASGLFPLPGIMNTIVGSFQSTTVGIAKAEQIGMSKVTNIGQTEMRQVGKEQHTTVGKTINVQVGQLYNLVSGEKYHGEAKVWEIYVEDTILLSAPGGYIEINKTGIRIHGLKVDIEGNQINFKKGGPGEGASCLRQMAQSSTPFVRG